MNEYFIKFNGYKCGDSAILREISEGYSGKEAWERLKETFGGDFDTLELLSIHRI